MSDAQLCHACICLAYGVLGGDRRTCRRNAFNVRVARLRGKGNRGTLHRKNVSFPRVSPVAVRNQAACWLIGYCCGKLPARNSRRINYFGNPMFGQGAFNSSSISTTGLTIRSSGRLRVGCGKLLGIAAAAA